MNRRQISRLFRVVNQYVGNLAPMLGVFPDSSARGNAGTERKLTMMRWGMPPPPKLGRPPITIIRNTSSSTEAGTQLLGPGRKFF